MMHQNLATICSTFRYVTHFNQFYEPKRCNDWCQVQCDQMLKKKYPKFSKRWPKSNIFLMAPKVFGLFLLANLLPDFSKIVQSGQTYKYFTLVN